MYHALVLLYCKFERDRWSQRGASRQKLLEASGRAGAILTTVASRGCPQWSWNFVHRFGLTYKVSAYNYHEKYDLCNTQISREYFEELTKRYWNNPLALCAGNSLVTGEFASHGPVTRGFDVFFDLCLNRRFIKKSRHRWFETPSRPLWRHCNVMIISYFLKGNSEGDSLYSYAKITIFPLIVCDDQWIEMNKIAWLFKKILPSMAKRLICGYLALGLIHKSVWDPNEYDSYFAPGHETSFKWI